MIEGNETTIVARGETKGWRAERRESLTRRVPSMDDFRVNFCYCTFLIFTRSPDTLAGKALLQSRRVAVAVSRGR